MAKKEKKDKKDKDALFEEEKESKGGKIVLFFVSLMVVVIWLAILAILIKTDVGAFGSSVLYPALKDVPYVNWILPEVDDSLLEDDKYSFDTIEDAVKRIKELERELGGMIESSELSSETIGNLEAQIADLIIYKENETAFEELKKKFYDEVVFSEDAPDIKEYKAFYESIDPENAEALYKQVVEQLAYDEKVQEYAKTYSSMKPKEAAAIFNTMEDNLQLVADILLAMDTQSRADILGKMDAEIAAKLTAIMEPSDN